MTRNILNVAIVVAIAVGLLVLAHGIKYNHFVDFACAAASLFGIVLAYLIAGQYWPVRKEGADQLEGF